MLVLASAELQQLLSALYLTLTKGANCLAKEEGSLILSCCRQNCPSKGKGTGSEGGGGGDAEGRCCCCWALC